MKAAAHSLTVLLATLAACATPASPEPIAAPQRPTESPSAALAPIEPHSRACTRAGLDLDEVVLSGDCSIPVDQAQPYVTAGNLVLEVPERLHVKAGQSLDIVVVARNVGNETTSFDFIQAVTFGSVGNLQRAGQTVDPVGGCIGEAFLPKAVRVTLAPDEMVTFTARFFAVESQQDRLCGATPPLAEGMYELYIYTVDNDLNELGAWLEIVVN